MAKQCFFDSMMNQYGENWLVGLTVESIQKQADRIFKEMAKGQIDYEKFGQYFLDGKLLENLIIAAGNELEVNTLLCNSLSYYSYASQFDPTVMAATAGQTALIGSELSHLQAMCQIYGLIYNKLKTVKETGNIGFLVDIASMLCNVRNHLQ